MGCSGSVERLKREVGHLAPLEGGNEPQDYSKPTRIIQEEEVDVCIEDEYDLIDDGWSHWPENYQVLEVDSEWIENESAGGSRNDLEAFATNPQFLLTLGPPEKHLPTDEFLFFQNTSGAVNISISLTQLDPPPPFHVAFFIYKTDKKDEKLTAEFFLCMQPVGETGAFVNWRQLRHEFRLTPGDYVVIPATFKPNLSRQFKISVHSTPPVSFKQLF